METNCLVSRYAPVFILHVVKLPISAMYTHGYDQSITHVISSVPFKYLFFQGTV